MSKITIELDLKDVSHIAAIHSLVRFLEIVELDDASVAESQRPFLDGYGSLHDETFWSSAIPQAIQKIMEASQFLITYGYEEKLNYMILHSDEWKSAISWLKQETASLDEQFIEAQSWLADREAERQPL